MFCSKHVAAVQGVGAALVAPAAPPPAHLAAPPAAPPGDANAVVAAASVPAAAVLPVHAAAHPVDEAPPAPADPALGARTMAPPASDCDVHQRLEASSRFMIALLFVYIFP
jgi:hypothetical protein